MAKVIVICGPTASGKSFYATDFSQKHQGVIINADSLQIYQGLEVLTAQPLYKTQKAFPHRLYSILSPTQTCSVADWVSLALKEIKATHLQGKLPLIVGGTGFYLKALMEGLTPLPHSSPSLRKIFHNQETPFLYEKLKICDPTLAHRLSSLDRQRIIRGLEIWESTGIPLSTWQTKKRTPPPYTFEVYLFTPSKMDLTERLRTRIDQMLDLNVLEEVEKAMFLPLSPTASKAIGLKEFSDYLKGQQTLEKAKELTLIRSQQYAKRQITWFRHQLKATSHI